MKNVLLALFGPKFTAKLARFWLWFTSSVSGPVGKYILFIVCSVAYFLLSIYAMEWPLLSFPMLIGYAIVVKWLHGRYVGKSPTYKDNLDHLRLLMLTITSVLVIFAVFAWQLPSIWLNWRFSNFFVGFLFLLTFLIMVWTGMEKRLMLRRIILWLTIGVLFFGLGQAYFSSKNQAKESEKEKASTKTLEEVQIDKTKAEAEKLKAEAERIRWESKQSALKEAKEYQNKNEQNYGTWELNISNKGKVKKFFPGWSTISVLTPEGKECYFIDSKGKLFTCDGAHTVSKDRSMVSDGYLLFYSDEPMKITLIIQKKTEKEILDLL